MSEGMGEGWGGSSDPLILFLRVDLSEVRAELGLANSWINEITRKWSRTKRLIMKEGRRVMRGIGSIIRSVRLTMRAVGMTLDPAMEAIITMASATVAAMTSISLAYAAGGPLGWASMILAAAGLGLALSAQAVALYKGEEVRRDMDKSIAAIDSWSATFSTLGGM